MVARQIVTVTQVITATQNGISMAAATGVASDSQLQNDGAEMSWFIVSLALIGALFVAVIMVAILLTCVLYFCLRKSKKSDVHKSKATKGKFDHNAYISYT